ncbi:MAG: CRISPR-associated protein Cas4 [Oscillibacter sp.]|nr:CRISPR-associated protein Cas4 [Oscillibacter sp.]
MEYPEDDWLMLSGIQHFAFCRRQWALIHLEGLWQENLRTVDGDLFHQRAHDAEASERRGNLLIVRGMRVFSRALGISGTCDVVEFYLDDAGIPLHGQEGLWQPVPVEYKRGEPKAGDADELQLCAQAMCLEEMLVCAVPGGSLFYGETRRRLPVVFTQELRERVKSVLLEMHQLMARGCTPRVRTSKSCNACSLKELCLPRLSRAPSVQEYLNAHEEAAE